MTAAERETKSDDVLSSSDMDSVNSDRKGVESPVVHPNTHAASLQEQSRCKKAALFSQQSEGTSRETG